MHFHLEHFMVFAHQRSIQIEARYGYEGTRERMCAHLRENKVPVLDAFKRITEGMCQLAESYKKLGLDGIYYAALGGERRYYTDEEFAEAIERL